MNPELKMVIATANAHKLSEISQILRGIPARILSLQDFPHIPPIVETGVTFQENALLKARTVYHATSLLTLADDSGLEVDALDGAPGIYSARFAGKAHDYPANNRKLLAALESLPDHQRGAQFRCVVALVGPEMERVVEGIVPGYIIRELKGSGGFGYDPLFVPRGYHQTFAEMDEALKNRISHRGIAFKKAEKILKKFLT